MAGITLADAQSNLDDWLAASRATSKAQFVMIQGQQVARPSAAHIQEQIKFWDRQVKRLSRGGIRMRAATPLG